jgi:hypothetical protein
MFYRSKLVLTISAEEKKERTILINLDKRIDVGSTEGISMIIGQDRFVIRNTLFRFRERCALMNQVLQSILNISL